jgi:hypothetical protein
VASYVIDQFERTWTWDIFICIFYDSVSKLYIAWNGSVVIKGKDVAVCILRISGGP